MKNCLKGNIPPLLEQYQQNNPNAKWEQFKDECQQGYKEVQEQLRLDQGNLCCYCEIETKQGYGVGKDDFRVEHFHPKACKLDESISSYNWALDWQNMLGCCLGGSERYVVSDEKTRFIEKKAERHSDVLKADSIWDDDILNPVNMPAFPILFKANRSDGSLSVDENNCRDAGIDIIKANNCLHPKKLNLNSMLLKEHRKKALDALNQQVANQLSQGLSVEQAMLNIAKAHTGKNSQQHWPAFFTTIRSYLGKIAEQHLKAMGYEG
jgi:uncharacterized protein (TIGR02646 family)